MEVYVANADIDRAIILFRKKIEKDGILREVKDRRCFLKPSFKRKRKHRRVLKRLKQMEARRLRTANR